jgi:hypothetical protein
VRNERERLISTRPANGPTLSIIVACVLAAAAAADVQLQAQGGSAPGGFVEHATTATVRTTMPADFVAVIPPRGAFTFPEPYNTTGVRLTSAEDCAGRDCVKAVGYSYWSNINNHTGSDTMLIFVGMDRRYGGAGPSLFSVNKQTLETRNLGPLFPANSTFSWSSGEGWYFSHTRPYSLYMNYGPRFMRYDVQARTLETIFDVTVAFGPNRYIWQLHSSADDRVHSGTLRDTASYAMLGCVAFREDQQQWYFVPRIGTFDECQIDKSGRWLVIKENVDGRYGEDNRVIDLETGTERVLLDENGAGGHSDLGFGYMVAADNFNPRPGAVRTWNFDLDVQGGQPVAAVSGQGTLAYHLTAWSGGLGHIAHGNARSDVAPDRQIACSSNASRQLKPRVNEIVCYRLDGSLDTLVVAPTMANLDATGGGTSDYNKLPKGNLDVTGEYFIWTTNAGTNRLDAFLVRVPMGLLAPAPVWEPVRWIDRVRVTATGGTLQKISGCNGCADAGAASEQRAEAGDIALRFTASDVSASRVVGLSASNTGTQSSEIVFGLRLRNGNVEVRESGIYRKDVRFVAGDTFEVRVEGGVVRYLKNDAVFYTSKQPPRYPLMADASLLTVGVTVVDAAIKLGS